MPASAVTTGVANGVMPDQILGGPLWWYFVVVYVLALGLALFVAIDSRRTVRADTLASLREPAWTYTVLQPLFLALALIVWLPFIPRALAVVPVLLTPLAIAGQVAYLLRVVFPKHPLATAEEFEILADGGDTAEPESSPNRPAGS